MDASQMKAKLAEIRFEHENGTHNFNEDSEHVQREDCESCFLISTIDTMIARRWDPTTGGPAAGDYLPELSFGMDEEQLESWLEQTRGVLSKPATKDRILSLLTTAIRVNETVGKTLIVQFAGEVEERVRREVLDNLRREGVISEPRLGKDPFDIFRWDVGQAALSIITRGGTPTKIRVRRATAGTIFDGQPTMINTPVGQIPIEVSDDVEMDWVLDHEGMPSVVPDEPEDDGHTISLERLIGRALIDEIRRAP